MGQTKYIDLKDIQKKKAISSELVLVFGFLGLIFLGSILLFLPFANNFPEFHPKYYLDCLFTSVSCVCVTGLSTVTAGEIFTPFGQAVMLFLIQSGGLGFMTMAVLLSRIIRRRITPKEQLVAAQSYGINTNENVRGLVTRIVVRTFIIEGVGALLLLTRMVFYTENFGKALWFSVFHCVSAFCNAGFDLFTGSEASLTRFSSDYFVLFIIMSLIVIGGIGFVVWDDIYDNIRRKKRVFTVYTKFILWVTGFLILSAAGLFLLFEWNNEKTIGNFSWHQKIVNGFFHAVSLRTAGFFTFDNGAMEEGTKLLSAIFMFIGGASGSTAGGIKVGTIAIIVFSVIVFAKGKKRITVGKRNVDINVVQRANAIFFIAAFAVVLFTSAISFIEDDFLAVDILYEAVSAFATVGLSAGITPHLSVLSKVLLMVLMYCGRVGFLTITTSLAKRNSEEAVIRYPNANFYVG